MSNVNLSNLLLKPGYSLFEMLTLSGNEWAFEWEDEAVAAGAEVQLIFTLSGANVILPSFRELQMDQEEGYVRLYASPDLTNFVPTSTITPSNQRKASTAETSVTLQVGTGATYTAANLVPPTIAMLGAAGQGNVPTTGDFASEGGFRVLEGAGSILVNFENASENAAYFKAYYKYFEVSPGFLPDDIRV